MGPFMAHLWNIIGFDPPRYPPDANSEAYIEVGQEVCCAHCLDDKNHSVPWFTILLYRPFLGTATYSPWIWLNHNHSPREFQESLVHPAFLFPNISNQTVVTMLMTVLMWPDFRYIIN